jgi:phosphoribosyl-AMP cyclohydrolase
VKGDTEKARLEEGRDLLLDFDKLKKVSSSGEAVIPVAVQDAETREVLLIGYASRTALDYTLKQGVAAFWSTSRNELWVKGSTSGDVLEVVDVRVNCEQNALLYLVRLKGHGSCHTKGPDGRTRLSCYYRRIKEGRLEFVE